MDTLNSHHSAFTKETRFQSLKNSFNSKTQIKELLKDPNRTDRLTCHFEDITCDLSKSMVTTEQLTELIALAQECGVTDSIHELFDGQFENSSESGIVMYPFLRSNLLATSYPQLDAMRELVATERKKMINFSDDIRHGYFKPSQEKITDVIHVGSGGSSLGPQLLVDALCVEDQDIRVHFLDNLDENALLECIQHLVPEHTLVVVASKSFATCETLSNASKLKLWMDQDTSHFFAVTAEADKARAFGIPEEQILTMPRDINGRFSLWSVMAFTFCIAYGYRYYVQLIEGAASMDKHFATSQLSQNIPVLLALTDLYQLHVAESPTLAIIPYSHRLKLLPSYLQQLFMESLGRSVDSRHQSIDYLASPIVWGGVGTCSQHSFHQLLFQSNHRVAVEFILPILSDYPELKHNQRAVIANCLSQSMTMLNGHGSDESHRNIIGNKASGTIIMKELNARNLGALIAMYEHRVFVLSLLHGVNAFDQWGVNTSKQAYGDLLPLLQSKQPIFDEKNELDASTRQLIDIIKKY